MHYGQYVCIYGWRVTLLLGNDCYFYLDIPAEGLKLFKIELCQRTTVKVVIKEIKSHSHIVLYLFACIDVHKSVT